MEGGEVRQGWSRDENERGRGGQDRRWGRECMRCFNMHVAMQANQKILKELMDLKIQSKPGEQVKLVDMIMVGPVSDEPHKVSSKWKLEQTNKQTSLAKQCS